MDSAEAAGYDSMVIPDSICYPEHATSTYPYSPDGTREFLDGKPFLEPFSLIPALGACEGAAGHDTPAHGAGPSAPLPGGGPGAGQVADVSTIRTTLPGGGHVVVVRGVYSYRADSAGRLAELRAY